MQTTTTMIQPHLDLNAHFSGLMKMFNHLPQNFLQHSINQQLANLTYSHKTLSRPSFSLDHKSDLEGLNKLIKTNDGTGHSVTKTSESMMKNHSSSIRMPTPVKPAYPKTIKETRLPLAKNIQNGRKVDPYHNISKQDFLFDQKFAGSNQSSLSLFADSLISNQADKLVFAPNYQNFDKNAWNNSDQNPFGAYGLINILNLNSLETTFEQLQQDFKDIMGNHQKLQSKILSSQKGCVNQNTVDKNSRNVSSNNSQKINSAKPFLIENVKTPRLNSAQSPATNAPLSEKNTPSPTQDVYSEVKVDTKKRGSNKKPVQVLTTIKEPSPQRRAVNKWQAMKAVEDQLRVEAEKPYVIDIHYNPENLDQKVKITTTGENYQVDVSRFALSKDNSVRRTVKMVWNPENIEQEMLDKYLDEISVLINEKSLNQEKVLRVLEKSEMNTVEALNQIKKDTQLYKTCLRQEQRILRSHGNNNRAPFYGA